MKKQFLLILGLMFTATIFAAPISKDAAKKNVLSFLQSKKGNKKFATAGMKQAQLTQVDYQVSRDAFYVFNIGDNDGFVITAADDRVETILGYSYEGSFDPTNVPVNMRQWLELYTNQINTVRDMDLNMVSKQYSEGEKTPYRHPISVMLTTKWNQSAPYNDMCPDYHNGNGKLYTGCVATAMAQVMNYHEWPKDEVGAIPGYTFYDDPQLGGNGKNKDVPGVKATTFNWDLMSDEYNYNSTKESKEEVAKLMRYCGQSLKMGYHPYASGAFTFDLPEALRKYFNYDKGAEYLDKDGISTYEWEDIVYNEIVNDRPVLYSGASDNAGGHQFVCDGYENGYFHFNWGWGGVSDGYFKLTSLNPEQEGVIGGNGLNFSDSQQIVIGVQPPVEGSSLPVDHIEIGYLQLTKDFNGEFKKNNLGRVALSIKSIFGVDTHVDVTYTVGFGLYDANGTLVEVSKSLDHRFVTGGYLSDKIITTSVTLGGDAIAKDGTYYLRPIVKNESGEFEVITSGDKKYFEVVVSGQNVKVTTYPIVNVGFSDVHLNGTVYNQCESSITATVENKGEAFDGIVYLTINNAVQTSVFKNLVMRKGEKQTVSLAFNIYSLDDTTIGVSVNGHQNSEGVFTKVIKSETKSPLLEIQPQTNIKSDGNYLDIPVEISNTSTDNDYIAPIKAVLYRKAGGSYKEITSVLVPVEVLKQAKTNVNVHFEGLDFNRMYYMSFNYYSFGNEKVYGGIYQSGLPKKMFSKYQTPDALSYFDVDGNMSYKVLAEGDTYEVPANACYVNVPKTISNRTIIPSSNMNCVYNIMPGVSTAMFKGYNIVSNGSCAELNISDTNDFNTINPVLTGKANLTINVENEMTTLYLPFEPQSVTCDGVELSKANSVEELATKDYALLPIVAEESNTVYCDFDASYGIAPAVLVVKKELVNKAIVFSAEKLTVDLSAHCVYGKYFNLNCSNKLAEYTEPIYGFGGKEFSKNMKSVLPFRIYLTSVLPSDLEKVNIVYPDGLIAGIEDVNADDINGKIVSVYSIDGVKVRTAQYGDNMLEGLPSGLYIVNGKKFVK